MKKLMLIVLAIALLLPAASFADPVTLKIDPAHTSVMFKVVHLVGRVPGWFNDVSGEIVFDEKNPANSSVEATIQAAGIDTRIEKRDNHLRSDDFFKVKTFPTLTYKSTKVEHLGGNKYKIHGDLTMVGVTRPVVLDMTFNGAQTDSKGNTRYGFSATSQLLRSDFGINWNTDKGEGKVKMIGNEVDIILEVEAL